MGSIDSMAEPVYKDTSIKLKILDTFHDFCTKERKKKTAGKKIEKKGDEEVSESKLEIMRDYIVKYLKNRFGIEILGADLTEQLNNDIAKLTESNVTGISDFENSVVKYYETTMPDEINLDGKQRETTTFQRIIDAYVVGEGENSPLWRQFRLNNDTVTVLEINKATRSIDTFSQAERNIIGNFILNFFFGTSQENPRCTFDATAGVPSKIFEDMDQIKNIIFPQTIADSATTTFGAMRGRNEFIFPGTRLSPMESAIYSQDKYALSFENIDFDSRNKYGFKINIKNKIKNATISLPFSITQTEGPSVNYLIDILDAAKKKPAKFDYGLIDKKKQILNLGKGISSNETFQKDLVADIKENKDGLLLDIKRSGDHEAVAATKLIRESRYPNFIFVTIDLLCAVESRKKGNPTIWHHGERLILYRFPIKRSAAAVFNIQLRDTRDRIKDAIASLTILQTIKTTVIQDLEKLVLRTEQGKTAQAAFNHSSTKLAKEKQELSRQITTFLLRKRMEKLNTQVKEVLAATKAAFATEEEENDYTKTIAWLESLMKLKDDQWVFGKESTNYTIEFKQKGTTNYDFGKDLQDMETEFKDEVAKVNTIIGIDVPVTITTTKTEIEKAYTLYVQMLGQISGNDLFLNTENPLFDYSAMPFFSLYKSLVILQEAKQNAEEQKKLATRVYKNLIVSELKNLSTALREIFDQFGKTEDGTDTPEQTELKTLSLFSESLTFENIFPKMDDFFKGMPAASKPAAYVGPFIQSGGKYLQKGGADAQQFLDAQDFLFEVSSMAAAFMESAYSTFYPEVALYTGIIEILKEFNSITKYIGSLQKSIHQKIEAENPGATKELIASLVQETVNGVVIDQPSIITNLENIYVKIERLGVDPSTIPKITTLEITAPFIEYHNAYLTSMKDALIPAYRFSLPLNSPYYSKVQEDPDAFQTLKDELTAFISDVKSIIEGTATATEAFTEILKGHAKTIEVYVGTNTGSRQFEAYKAAITKEQAERTLTFFTEKYKQLFPYERTIHDFYNKILSIDSSQGSMDAAREVVENMQQLWETGLYLMKTNESYTYEFPTREKSISTDEYITLLLSLKRDDARPEIVIQSLINENFLTGLDKPEAELTPAEKARLTFFNNIKTEMTWDISPNPENNSILVNPNVTLPILMIFTAIENMQNPNKESFFLEDYKTGYFKEQEKWRVDLWTKLDLLVRVFAERFYSNQLPLNLKGVSGGGSRKKRYAKHTRKAKYKTSKRKTRRSKQ